MNYLKDRKPDAPAEAMPSTAQRSPLELHPTHSHASTELPNSISGAARAMPKQHSRTATGDESAVDLTTQRNGAAAVGTDCEQQQRNKKAKQQQAAAVGGTSSAPLDSGAAKLDASKIGMFYDHQQCWSSLWSMLLANSTCVMNVVTVHSHTAHSNEAVTSAMYTCKLCI